MFLILPTIASPSNKRSCPNVLTVKSRANGRRIVGQQFPTLLDVTCCVRLHTPLHVVACCWELLRKVWNLSNFWPTNSNTSFVPWSPKPSAKMLDPFCSSSCLVGATHAHHTCSTWILQSLMGCILPTMHWSVQHCCKWKKFNATAAHFYLSLKRVPCHLRMRHRASQRVSFDWVISEGIVLLLRRFSMIWVHL